MTTTELCVLAAMIYIAPHTSKKSAIFAAVIFVLVAIYKSNGG